MHLQPVHNGNGSLRRTDASDSGRRSGHGTPSGPSAASFSGGGRRPGAADPSGARPASAAAYRQAARRQRVTSAGRSLPATTALAAATPAGGVLLGVGRHTARVGAAQGRAAVAGPRRPLADGLPRADGDAHGRVRDRLGAGRPRLGSPAGTPLTPLALRRTAGLTPRTPLTLRGTTGLTPGTPLALRRTTGLTPGTPFLGRTAGTTRRSGSRGLRKSTVPTRRRAAVALRTGRPHRGGPLLRSRARIPPAPLALRSPASLPPGTPLALLRRTAGSPPAQLAARGAPAPLGAAAGAFPHGHPVRSAERVTEARAFELRAPAPPHAAPRAARARPPPHGPGWRRDDS